TQHAQPLGVGGHDAVLDAVVYHFDEVAGAIWPAMQITLLGAATNFFTPRRAWDVTHAWGQTGKDGIEVLDHRLFAANHHAVASLQTPDATTRSHVYVVDALRREFPGAPDIVNVIGIASIDQHVLCLEMGQEIRDRVVHDRRGNHQPDHPRFRELLDKVHERGGPNRFVLDQLVHDLRRPVEDHALMTCLEKPPCHIRTHASQTNHADLHSVFLLCNSCSDSFTSCSSSPCQCQAMA